MSDTITRDEWLAEMERLSAARPADDEGWTTKEWAEQMRCNSRTANERLRTAHRAGRLVHGHRAGESTNGRRIAIDVYRIGPSVAP